MRLSVIIPAYNEERRLSKTLVAIDKYLRNQEYDYEILAVNDGSRDKTVEIANSLLPKIRNLKVTGYKKNQGKGYAVRFGMLEAKGDYRLFTDADNSTTINQIEKVWPELQKGFDIVIGSRDVKGAVLDPPQPWIRKILLGEGFKLYRKILIGLWEIEDTQCGFKCFSGEAAEKVFQKCLINRFAFDPEILVIAQKLGYRIKEIPVYWKNDLESKVKFKSIFKIALDLIKIKGNLIAKKYG
jgi:dolichyl-phosphate beta-glucosyltransferase